MPPTFLLFLALMVLGYLGIPIFLAFLVGLRIGKWRTNARRGAIWGLVGGVMLSIPLALITAGMSEGLGHEFVQFVVQAFFAGFALGAAIWSMFHFLSQVRDRTA